MSEYEDIEKELRQQLTRRIEQEILSRAPNIWGHGTLAEEAAEKILAEGIVGSRNYGLTEIAVPLTTENALSEDNSRAIVDAALKWPHREAKYVVLISVPPEFRKEEVVELVQVDGQERSRLPARFVTGYIDALNMKLVMNEQFQDQPTKTEAHVSVQGLPHSQRKDVSVEVPQPVADSGGETEDVW